MTDCFLPTDREHQPRGFAFVTMPAKDADVACVKVNGLELDGRTLRVNAVTDCFLPTDREHQPRGFAFVTKDAEVACAKVNGLELDGRTLRVNEAQPKGEYILRHYHDQFTCMKQRKWFEDLRSSDKVICVFTSGVFNGEFDDEGDVNIISLFAVFPFTKRIQPGVVPLDGIVDSGEE